MNCHQCHTTLPEQAKFCFNCGAPQKAQSTPIERAFIDFDVDVIRQLDQLFLEALTKRVKEEHQEEQLPAYRERLYESGFRDLVNRRGEQIAENLQQLRTEGAKAAAINQEVKYNFEELLDYFIIRYCGDLNTIGLPETILKYQDLGLENIDLFELIPDYLAFEQENETIYTDFVKMPIEKLKNASKSYLFPEKNEKILFICDQSLLGSCKEGFAMTEKALYWKAHLEKARVVAYPHLKSVARTKDWLSINGYFFNVSPSLNLKMMKLLKKIRFGRP